MSDSVADKTHRGKDGRFLTGHKRPGPGRPLGSRVKLEEIFVADMVAAWQVHGKAALDKVAATEPAKFATIAASILPKHSVATKRLEVMSDAELAAIVAEGIGKDLKEYKGLN